MLKLCTVEKLFLLSWIALKKVNIADLTAILMINKACLIILTTIYNCLESKEKYEYKPTENLEL